MTLFSKILVLISLMAIASCKPHSKTYELHSAGFNASFSFEGYVVDNGYGKWVYFLDGDSNGLEIRHDAPLMEHGDLFSCPSGIKVEVINDLIRYSLSEGAEAQYNRQKSESCVLYYSQIFSELILKQSDNLKTY